MRDTLKSPRALLNLPRYYLGTVQNCTLFGAALNALGLNMFFCTLLLSWNRYVAMCRSNDSFERWFGNGKKAAVLCTAAALTAFAATSPAVWPLDGLSILLSQTCRPFVTATE